MQLTGKRLIKLVPWMVALVTTTAPAFAAGPFSGGTWEYSGSVGVENRVFFEKGTLPGQFDTFQPSLQFEGDIRWQSDAGDWELVMVPFGRLDAQDNKRSHVDMREAYVRWNGEDWTVRAGLAKVFWGVAESRHLVDIINQTDSIEDVDDEDKLGQPMLEVSTSQGWGQLTAYVMPAFRKQTFAGINGRLRAPFLIDNDLARFDQGQSESSDVDLAIRYSHYFGNWDIGLSAFYGTSREARLIPAESSTVLAPYYDDIKQIGADLQYTKGAWLWKFEGIVRDTPFETFTAVVAGTEFTFYGITSTGADLGVLAEIQYDSRSENPLIAAQTPANEDLFAGMRLALNDIEDTSLLAGVITDLKDGSMSGLIEASRRFGDTWIGEIEGRFFMNTDPQNLLHGFRKDSHLMMRLTHYF